MREEPEKDLETRQRGSPSPPTTAVLGSGMKTVNDGEMPTELNRGPATEQGQEVGREGLPTAPLKTDGTGSTPCFWGVGVITLEATGCSRFTQETPTLSDEVCGEDLPQPAARHNAQGLHLGRVWPAGHHFRSHWELPGGTGWHTVPRAPKHVIGPALGWCRGGPLLGCEM